MIKILHTHTHTKKNGLAISSFLSYIRLFSFIYIIIYNALFFSLSLSSSRYLIINMHDSERWLPALTHWQFLFFLFLFLFLLCFNSWASLIPLCVPEDDLMDGFRPVGCITPPSWLLICNSPVFFFFCFVFFGGGIVLLHCRCLLFFLLNFTWFQPANDVDLKKNVWKQQKKIPLIKRWRPRCCGLQTSMPRTHFAELV